MPRPIQRGACACHKIVRRVAVRRVQDPHASPLVARCHPGAGARLAVVQQHRVRRRRGAHGGGHRLRHPRRCHVGAAAAGAERAPAGPHPQHAFALRPRRWQRHAEGAVRLRDLDPARRCRPGGQLGRGPLELPPHRPAVPALHLRRAAAAAQRGGPGRRGLDGAARHGPRPRHGDAVVRAAGAVDLGRCAVAEGLWRDLPRAGRHPRFRRAGRHAGPHRPVAAARRHPRPWRAVWRARWRRQRGPGRGTLAHPVAQRGAPPQRRQRAQGAAGFQAAGGAAHDGR